MLSRTRHVYLFSVGTAAWALFWVAGLPGYYRQYSAISMAWFEIALALLLGVVFWSSLRRRPAPERMASSLWMAFYFTVPLAFYDWLYCGVVLGEGLRFVFSYWYLTTYYVLPWLLLPALALLANRQSGLESAAQPRHRADSRTVD